MLNPSTSDSTSHLRRTRENRSTDVVFSRHHRRRVFLLVGLHTIAVLHRWSTSEGLGTRRISSAMIGHFSTRPALAHRGGKHGSIRQCYPIPSPRRRSAQSIENRIAAHYFARRYAISTLMTMSAFLIFAWGSRRPKGERVFTSLAGIICLVAGVAYFTMGANLGISLPFGLHTESLLTFALFRGYAYCCGVHSSRRIGSRRCCARCSPPYPSHLLPSIHRLGHHHSSPSSRAPPRHW